VRKIVRTTYYLGVILLFAAIVVVGFTQTNAFRSYLRDKIIEATSTGLNGELSFGPLRGNLFTGFHVDSILVRESGQDLATIDRLEARYDPLSLLAKHVSITRLTLVNPTVNITRSADGSWNVTRLIKRTHEDTTPSPWVLDLKQLQLKDAHFTLLDSLRIEQRMNDSTFVPSPDFVDYADFRLDSLDLDAGATIRAGSLSALIRSLSFTLARPHLRLKQFGGEFKWDPSSTTARKLEVETEQSGLRLDAAIEQTDIMKIGSLAALQRSPLFLRLNVVKLDLGELKAFVGPAIGFLDKEVSGQVDADGAFGLLHVRDAIVKTPRSTVHVTGTLAHLDHPRDLELDVVCNMNKVDPQDAAELLPGLHLPQLDSLGPIECDLSFKGRPTLFNARLASVSRVGAIDADAQLDTQHGDLSYDGTLTTRGFNLAQLLGDSLLSSSLNGTATIKGSGTHLNNLTAVIRAEVDSSTFYGLPVGRSVIVTDIADRTARTRVAVHVSSTRLDLSGKMTVGVNDSLSYEINGRVNSLNLAEITKRKQQTSDLSFDLQAQGTGVRLNALRGELGVKFLESSFDTVSFGGGGFTVRLNTMDRSHQSLHVTSDAADLDVDGTFTPATFLSTITNAAALLGRTVRYRLNTLDSLRAFSPGQAIVAEFRPPAAPDPREPVDAVITLRVKDCYPLGVLLRTGLYGSLSLSGRVKTSPEGDRLSGRITMGQLELADQHLRMGFQDAVISYEIGGLAPASVMDSLSASVGLQARHFDINSLRSSGLAADLKVKGGASDYRLSVLLDSLIRIDAEGTSTDDSGFVNFDLARLKVEFGTYTLENTDPVHLKLGSDGLEIAKLQLRHEAEEMNASGYFDPQGMSDLAVSAKNFLLNELPKIFPRLALGEPEATFSGEVNAAATFRGSFEDPMFSLDVNAAGVRYANTSFGQILARWSYAEHMLRVSTEFRSRPEDPSLQPDLVISGTVPYNLSLRSTHEQKLEGEMNLDIHSANFRLEFLNPFIAQIGNLSGVLACDLRLEGTVRSPLYEGSLSIENGRFFFKPLNLTYVLGGKLVPSGQRIGLKDVAIRNIQEDRPDGAMALSGTFTLEGIQIKDFDISANGQLLVMKESARRPGQSLYGDLFVATGSDGVKWQGTPERSNVSGTLSIKNANLTLPPTREAQSLPSSTIPVRVIDDVAAARQGNGEPESGTGSVAASQGAKEPPGAIHRPPMPVLGSEVSETSTGGSFLDNIQYNLVIETQGLTQVRFVFTNLTNEELFAILKGKATFRKDGDQVRLTGEVELGNGSYYSNIKKLDASGKLRFTGDPFNPELDVVATYEGYYRGTVDTTSAAARSAGGTSTPGATQGLEQKVIVKLDITGTREQPKVKTELERYDQFGNLLPQTTGDVEGDAIAFLITGSFRDELTQQDRLALASSNVLGGLTSSVLSGPLTDLLRKEFGIIRSVDVLYYGGSFQESADVRLTGEVGDAVFRLGGRVLNDINNANVSIQLPMSSILGSEKWRNLVLEAERRVEGLESVDQRRESKGIRLLYRIIF
jgi:hypothetical protein